MRYYAIFLIGVVIGLYASVYRDMYQVQHQVNAYWNGWHDGKQAVEYEYNKEIKTGVIDGESMEVQ